MTTLERIENLPKKMGTLLKSEAEPINFDDLYCQYKQAVYNFACSLTQDPSEADDLFQETWLRIVQNIKKARSSGNLKSWVFTITMNIHRDNLRKKKVRKMFFLKHIQSPQKSTASPMNHKNIKSRTSGDEIYHSDIKRAISRAVGALPLRLKKVFVLKEIEGFKYKEVSHILNMPIGTVKSVNHRAILRMRKELWDFSPRMDMNSVRRNENEMPGS